MVGSAADPQSDAMVFAGDPKGEREIQILVRWGRTGRGCRSARWRRIIGVDGDWVPMGISTVAGTPISSNSLDNTLRILDVGQTDWYLLEIESAGINNGFGHGHLRIWGDDGKLHAIASQSVLVRRRDPDAFTSS